MVRKKETTLLPLMIRLQIRAAQVDNDLPIHNIISPFVELLAKFMLEKDVTYYYDFNHSYLGGKRSGRVEYVP